jgi:hypothetical protein
MSNHRQNISKSMRIVNGIILILMLLTLQCFLSTRSIGHKRRTIKIAESLQMKLDKDPFLANINMIELDGKKVLVQPSQAESTKGKEVIIGEERPPRMIKPKSPKDGQWQKNKGSKP